MIEWYWIPIALVVGACAGSFVMCLVTIGREK